LAGQTKAGKTELQMNKTAIIALLICTAAFAVNMTPCGEYGKRFTYFRQTNEYMYEYCHWFIWKGHYDAKTGKLLTYTPIISEDTYQHIRNDFCTVIPEWGDRYVDEECFQEKINRMQNIFFPKLFDQLKAQVNIYRAGYENLGD
jgi:hypothetical protein